MRKIANKLSNTQIIEEIKKYVKIYDENLKEKNLLFVCFNKQDNSAEYLQAEFLIKHFWHLTGLKYANGQFRRTSSFYYDALKGTITEQQFIFDSKKFISEKITAMAETMLIHKKAREIGDFDDTSSVKLLTDKLAGNRIACLGFALDDGNFFPNTNLLDNIRNRSKLPTFPIICILRKSITEQKYSEITYQNNNFSFSELKIPSDLKGLITIKAMNQLKLDFEDSIKLEDFQVSRIINDEDKLYYAEVSINGESGKYEILHGEDNESINKLCEDFGISVKLAREVLDKADEMDVTHMEVTQEISEDSEYAPNKDPPEHADELDIIE